MFDDFIELFCRLVVSNLWIYGTDDEISTLDHRIAPPESGREGGMRRSSSRVTTGSIVEQALAKRLSAWLKLI
jgi:hypothetical protein